MHPKGSRTIFEKAVHYLNRFEKGLVFTLELAEHIRHPVHHARPHLSGNGMAGQEIVDAEEVVLFLEAEGGVGVLLPKPTHPLLPLLLPRTRPPLHHLRHLQSLLGLRLVNSVVKNLRCELHPCE